MPAQDFFTYIKKVIIDFENKATNNRNIGIIYTPKPVVDNIVFNIFKIYFKEYFNFPDCSNLGSFYYYIKQRSSKNDKFKKNFIEKLRNIKILDPACGSGRFIISTAETLYQFWKIIKTGLNNYETKRKIIQNNIYGIDIDKSAYIITKLRLFSWLFSGNEKKYNFHNFNQKGLSLEKVNLIINKNEINLNIYHLDFLLDFEFKKFDIILGNPPYVENKKIKDFEYKRKLYENFKSAYKLFDLSIVFIEKSIELLKENGYLSFILPNKFLSADFGIKIRELLIKNTEIREIVNISSLYIFQKAATYPIILYFKKGKYDDKNEITISKFNDLDDLLTYNSLNIIKFPQKLITGLPSNVIPVSGNINLIKFLYNKYKSIKDSFKALKIIYRPFGFLKYSKHFDNVSKEPRSEKDLLLIGTGNVEKYYIKYNKRIKIAKKDFEISYFNYKPTFEHIWQDLNSEKIIFREIAKNLTCVYDPGIFTNITGLYFVKIPSINTKKLYCFLTILNSKLLDTVFKTLFSSLHMAGGYLRFNGSFIKRLPAPQNFPSSLSNCGKILQILSQLHYDLNSEYTNEISELKFLKEKYQSEIFRFIRFFKKISNGLVNLLYLDDFYLESNLNFNEIRELLYSELNLKSIQFKYLLPRYNINKYFTYSLEELDYILNGVKNFLNMIHENKSLLYQIDEINNINLS
ncbi:MAG: class I SAM-dependent DNA methyltransferase [Promethearchaeota archaeon]